MKPEPNHTTQRPFLDSLQSVPFLFLQESRKVSGMEADTGKSHYV
jgi:hypothetical protein